MRSGCKTKQVMYNSTEIDCTVYSRKPENTIYSKCRGIMEVTPPLE